MIRPCGHGDDFGTVLPYFCRCVRLCCALSCVRPICEGAFSYEKIVCSIGQYTVGLRASRNEYADEIEDGMAVVAEEGSRAIGRLAEPRFRMGDVEINKVRNAFRQLFTIESLSHCAHHRSHGRSDDCSRCPTKAERRRLSARIGTHLAESAIKSTVRHRAT